MEIGITHVSYDETVANRLPGASRGVCFFVLCSFGEAVKKIIAPLTGVAVGAVCLYLGQSLTYLGTGLLVVCAVWLAIDLTGS